MAENENKQNETQTPPALPFWFAGGNTSNYPSAEFVLFNNNLRNRDLWLDCDVDQDNCAFIIQYIQYLNTFEADNMEPIKLHIMSNGGDTHVMFELYDTMMESKIPITTINEGDAHSAAFIIFLAGDRRIMRDHALFISHEGSASVSGTHRETKAFMQEYNHLIELMVDVIVERTNLDKDFVKEKYDSDNDWYIRKDDARKFGIITEG